MGISLNPLSGLFDLLGSASVGIGTPITGSDPHRILITDGSSPTPLLGQTAALTNGQIVIGSTGLAPVVANILGTTNQATITNGAGSIQISLPQDIHAGASPTFESLNINSNSIILDANGNPITINASASAPRTFTIPDVGADASFVMTEGSQTIDGAKTFSVNTTFSAATGITVSNAANIAGMNLSGNIIDLQASGTLALGGTNSDIVNLGPNASIINIGNPTATVNIQGTINNITTTNTNVTDALITINSGGGAGTAGNTGLEFEENAVVTGYIKTSADRNNITFKAPAQAGVITMPSATGSENVAYESWVIASYAERDLSNLTSTALNQSIIPDTTDTLALGSTALKFNNIHVTNVVASLLGNETVGNLIDLDTMFINDAASQPVLDIDNHQLMDNAGGLMINFASAGIVSVNNNLVSDVLDPVTDQDAATKIYVDSKAFSPTTTFNGVNAQAIPDDVTGLVFTKTGKAIVHIFVDATASLYEAVELLVVNKGATFDITQGPAVGDNSLVDFTITSAGQVQYTSGSYAGFVDLVVDFKFIEI